MAASDRNSNFDLYTLFADERYSEFEVDNYTFDASLDEKEKQYFNYDAHEILPYILSRNIRHGDEELKDILGIEKVEKLHNEGDKVKNLTAEDWVIEGEKNIALGQACCTKYKPLKGGMPYDIRQAFWFHGEFERSVKYKGNKELQSPHTVSINNNLEDFKKDSLKTDSLEIIVRKLDSEKKSEATLCGAIPLLD